MMSRAHTQAAPAVRPAVPGPGGAETWYRITNSLDADAGTAVASVHIYGDIGSWGISASSFVEELKAVDASEITLYINSPGGEVFDGLAIHNALRSHRARVMVQVDSLAASIASVIAMAGDRISMAPHSQMMIHNASGVACGDAAELREYADFLDRQSENIAGVYAERAGGTVKQWLKAMADETWYFADEAVAAGLADEVAKPQRMPDEDEDRALAASWDLSVYNYAHTSREEAPPPDTGQPPPAAPQATTTNPPDEPGGFSFDPAVFRAATMAALDPMPDYDPGHLRSLMASVAGDAPAVPPPRRPEPVAVAGPAPAAVPEPPAPANEVAVDYFRQLMAIAANDLAAPEQPAAPDPGPPEPVPAIDIKAFNRSLREARL